MPWGTKSGSLASRKNVSERVHRAVQRSYFSALSTGEEVDDLEPEEPNGKNSTSSGFESYGFSHNLTPNGEGEDINRSSSNTTKITDELHYMERERSE